MKHLIAFLFCLTLMGQAIPPSSPKPTLVKLADPDTPTAARTVGFIPGTNVTITKSCTDGVCSFTFNAASGGYTLPTATGSVLGGIKIGTGLTIDGNGVVTASGGSSTSYLTFPAANCQLGAASTGFTLPATLYPTATCSTTNALFGYLSFSENGAAAAESIETRVALKGTITSFDVWGQWKSVAITNAVVWQIQGKCVGDGEEPADVAWSAAQAITDTASGTTLKFNDFALTGFTPTSCTTGKTLFVKFFRDATHASDTLSGAARLVTLGLTINR
jgi:hypothetical protein